MMGLDWQVVAEIATTVSTVAFAASAIVVVLQLQQAARERYFSVTAHLFEIWQSPEFQHDQLFILHKLPNPTWEEFCALGRGDDAERAIHRVGGFYDRVGNLVHHRLIRKDDILPTVGGYAVAVWHRIEPLVKELRLRENALLFENYEALLPECHDCYVPGIAHQAAAVARPDAGAALVDPLMCEVPAPRTPTIKSVSISEDETNGRSAETVIRESTALTPKDLSLPDTDGIRHRLAEFTGTGLAVLVYARGAWCPYCLRQLADYAECYDDFKKSGIEVLAISPESQRRSRRMRRELSLPFAVLSDSKLDAAARFGLLGHEKPGQATPATLVLDRERILMSTLNEWEKCVSARDVLQYLRRVKQPDTTIPVPVPAVTKLKPGRHFALALMNMAVGAFSR